uniref:Ciliary neurotrophic factor n=1 Tax=Branchiostoma floridae TaxID=7739 RepID=C3XTF3_BRAFL|eukprot:XP_002612570.1 hypothetical protein BRAFLDRAFT_78809 [Branchiostoma floridae]
MAQMTAVYMLAVFCGVFHSAAAVPVTTVAPAVRSQQTVTEALTASLQKTELVLERTTTALGTINTVHFSGTASYPDLSVTTLPSSEDIIKAEDIETSAMEDSEVFQTLKSQLHIFERHLEAVKLDQLALEAADNTGEVEAVRRQANALGHPLDNTNEHVDPGTATSEFYMTLRAYLTFRDYEIFLSHLSSVFAELEERESIP